jgi:ubiquinone/menaquinone biosynthesis C-methylase UbiE
VSHEKLVRDEFARQAEAMAASPAFTSEEVIGRFRDALGSRPKGRVLDLACGPGILSAALAPQADLMVGVDITPEMLRKARQRCGSAGLDNARFLEATAEALPFAPAAFGCVVTRLSVHHLQDPATVLREARRVLRPDGSLILADVVSSPDTPESDLHNALEHLRDPSHVRMLSEPDLLRALAEARFAVASSSRWQQRRQFGEWAAIVRNARSLGALEVVMRALAGAGMTAGIDLRLSGGSLEFVHHYLLVVARPEGR